MDEYNQGIFFKIRVVFVQFCIEGQGDLPPSPSSYTPATGRLMGIKKVFYAWVKKTIIRYARLAQQNLCCFLYTYIIYIYIYILYIYIYIYIYIKAKYRTSEQWSTITDFTLIYQPCFPLFFLKNFLNVLLSLVIFRISQKCCF